MLTFADLLIVIHNTGDLNTLISGEIKLNDFDCLPINTTILFFMEKCF